MNSLQERVIDGNLINYKILNKNNELNIFFDNKTFDLIGWQNKDAFQNFNITYLLSIRKNRVISENMFKLPLQD